MGTVLSIHLNENEKFWYGTVNREGREYFFRIYYTPFYPLFPPRFFCFSDASYSHLFFDEQWRPHVLPEGNLCLFANDEGESGWRPEYRLDTVIKKFSVLADLTKNLEVSTQHASKRFSINNYSFPAAVYLPNCIYEKLKQSENGSDFYFSFFNPRLMAPQGAQLPIIAIFDEKDTEFNDKSFSNKGKGVSYFLPQKNYRRLKNNLLDSDKFQKFCANNDITLNYGISNVILIGCKDKPFLSPFLIHFFNGYPRPVLEYLKIKEKDSFFEAIFEREKSYLSEVFDILKQKKVLLIGLGTIGCKIASELCRNGIQEFYLFDYDFYLPENVARGIGPWELVGKSKTEVISIVLTSISPKIITHKFDTSPLNPLVKPAFEKALKEVDLVICAIDSELDEKEIQRICVINKRTAIYTIALENGHYGRIYRVIPEITACPECILRQINEEPEKYPNLIKANLNPTSNQQAPYQQPGIPGINLDLWEIALKTTRFCLETLARGTPMSQYFPDPPYHHILMSNQTGWIFDAPYQIKTQDFKKLEDCPLCGKGKFEKQKEIDQQKAEIFSKLREKYVV